MKDKNRNNDVNIGGIGGHSYRGLLYDAKKGVTVSQILIYQAFVSMMGRGERPPMDMLDFIAKEMGLVLAEKQKPEKMFKKSKGKLPTSSPHYWELVELTRKAKDFSGDIHAAFEHVSNIFEGKPSPSQIREHYYKEKSRMERIRTVAILLNEYDQILAIPRLDRPKSLNTRLEEIDSQLQEIYSDIDTLT